MEYIGFTGMIFTGDKVYKLVKMKEKYFMKITKLIFNEILKLDLDKDTLKKYSNKISRVFEDTDGKQLGRYGLWKYWRKHFKELRKLNKVFKKVEPEIFEELLKKGLILKFFNNLENIKKLLSVLLQTEKITSDIMNMMILIEPDTKQYKTERRELYLNIFEIVDKDPETITELFKKILKSYSNTLDYKKFIEDRRIKLLELLNDKEELLKHKERIKLKKIKNIIEDLDINNLYQVEEVGNENDNHRDIIDDDTIILMDEDKRETLKKVDTIINNSFKLYN